jgi:hypothetical protein
MKTPAQELEDLNYLKNQVGPCKMTYNDEIQLKSEFEWFIRDMYNLVFPHVKPENVNINAAWIFLGKVDNAVIAYTQVEEFWNGKLENYSRRKIYDYILKNKLENHSCLGAREKIVLHSYKKTKQLNREIPEILIDYAINRLLMFFPKAGVKGVQGLWDYVVLEVMRFYRGRCAYEDVKKHWPKGDIDVLEKVWEEFGNRFEFMSKHPPKKIDKLRMLLEKITSWENLTVEEMKDRLPDFEETWAQTQALAMELHGASKFKPELIKSGLFKSQYEKILRVVERFEKTVELDALLTQILSWEKLSSRAEILKKLPEFKNIWKKVMTFISDIHNCAFKIELLKEYLSPEEYGKIDGLATLFAIATHYQSESSHNQSPSEAASNIKYKKVQVPPETWKILRSSAWDRALAIPGKGATLEKLAEQIKLDTDDAFGNKGWLKTVDNKTVTSLNQSRYTVPNIIYVDYGENFKGTAKEFPWVKYAWAIDVLHDKLRQYKFGWAMMKCKIVETKFVTEKTDIASRLRTDGIYGYMYAGHGGGGAIGGDVKASPGRYSPYKIRFMELLACDSLLNPDSIKNREMFLTSPDKTPWASNVSSRGYVRGYDTSVYIWNARFSEKKIEGSNKLKKPDPRFKGRLVNNYDQRNRD